MNDSKRLFFAEATLQRIRNYILSSFSVLIIFYCGFHFNENPVLICIIIVFLLFTLIFTGYNQIAVYNNSIEFTLKRPLNSLIIKKTFLIDNIESIDADLKLSKRGFIITEILSTYFPGNSIWNTIKIKLKDGTEKTINTKVYKRDVIQALSILKSKSQNKIIIMGI